MNWINGSDCFPDWQDCGREVEILMEDNSIIVGELFADDFFASCDGEEVPLLMVKQKDGEIASFVECKKWRFLSD